MEYYIVVIPFKISPEIVFKAPSRKDAIWLENQLKQAGHKVRVERTQGGTFDETSPHP